MKSPSPGRRIVWRSVFCLVLAAGSFGVATAVSPAAQGEEALLEPGRVFRDCPECPEMVVIPAGSFMMGSPRDELGRNKYEGPRHRVTLPKPFAVGKYEVTFAEWDACVADGDCGGHRPGDHGWGRGRRPVINVGWHAAQAYVNWLSKKTGKRYRLPSEAEWEYAARGGTRASRYWGDDAFGFAQCAYANGADGTLKARNSKIGEVAPCRDGFVQTAPVGSFSANPFGLHDVLGNVMEWVEDCWNERYVGAPADGSARRSGDCSRRVVRGGSWVLKPWHLRSAFRFWSAAGRNTTIGFRVARTLAPRTLASLPRGSRGRNSLARFFGIFETLAQGRRGRTKNPWTARPARLPNPLSNSIAIRRDKRARQERNTPP